MHKKSDLSNVQKIIIIRFQSKDGTIYESAEFMNFTRASVVKVCSTWQNKTIKISDMGNCCDPWYLNEKEERRLRR